MRRSDREIKEFEEILKVIEKCDVCRLALNDEDYPYILPLNFGMKVEGTEVTLYFHGATSGRKYELISRDSRASFEMDCAHKLISDREKGHCTMSYESVIGRGRLEVVPEEEKLEALTILTDHYHEEHFVFNTAAMSRTTVLKLKVEQMTAKRRAARLN